MASLPSDDPATAGVTPEGPAPAAVPSEPPKVSLWDFIIQRRADGVLKYLERMNSQDARDNTSLVSRILDQRVEQSVRFSFYNPVIGQHGYRHILSDVPLCPKGTTSLHLAVLVRDAPCVTALLQYAQPV